MKVSGLFLVNFLSTQLRISLDPCSGIYGAKYLAKTLVEGFSLSQKVFNVLLVILFGEL